MAKLSYAEFFDLVAPLSIEPEVELMIGDAFRALDQPADGPLQQPGKHEPQGNDPQ